MGKHTISMAIFNSYVSLPEGTRKKQKGTSSINNIEYQPTPIAPSNHGEVTA